MHNFNNPIPIGAARPVFAATLAFAALTASAQQPDTWQFGYALDLSAASRQLALGQRDRGLGLGHSDVSARGPLGRHFDAQVTAVTHTAERKFEFELEEAWLQTRTLPSGLQVRAGRFASQLGYLNEQHPHSDDFVERPLLYRAFFGGHWIDDGLRINWTAPTDVYMRFGLEAFRGRGLVPDAAATKRPGVLVLTGRIGGDIGRSQSWQAGLSLVHNRRGGALEDDAEAGHAEDHDDHASESEPAHAHSHGAAFGGRRMRVADLAWKWSPDGNNRQQQVRVAYEHAWVDRVNRFATRGDSHRASYLSVVWRFAPAWEAGVRADLLKVRRPHEDHFDDGRLRESALMLAYKPSHTQTLRVQLTKQNDRVGFPGATRAVQIQYILTGGAHAAHSF
ncbi:MAG: hypothetical protein AB7E83_12285 [Ramlibacter sp.]